MASSPSDVHTLNMASSPSNVRTLIVDGFPPQEELSKLYLYVQFLLDEDQIADFIGMTDDRHAIILHGSSYLPSDKTCVTEFNAANPNPLTAAAPVISATHTTTSCAASMHPVMTEVPSYNMGYSSLPVIPPDITDISPKTNMYNGNSSKLTMPYQMPSYQQLPRLPLFHGEHHKGENSYQHWKYEVNSLLQDRIYPEPFIMQAIRRSLRGEAADVLRHVGPKASIASILEKMDLVFGNILPSNLIFERFCTAEQKASESVAE